MLTRDYIGALFTEEYLRKNNELKSTVSFNIFIRCNFFLILLHMEKFRERRRR